jgi:pectate lyase
MRGRFTHRIVLAILLVCQISVCLGQETADPNNSSKYLDAVREFADNVLKYGRDTYGPKHTPLFVDGLNIHSHEPVKWIDPDGTKWIISNLASQQTLMRTLDGLSRITGNPKYREAAMQAIEYALERLRTPSGLLYWGGGAAYDASADKVADKIGEYSFGFKLDYPHYELMWRVDPNETKRFIEALWSAHVRDWSNLDFNRIAIMSANLEEPWNHEYKGGPTFFKSKYGGGGFFTTGTSLVQAGATLYRLSGHEQPLVWSRRLVKRFVETRHPKTGISVYMYNNPWRSLGDDLKEHFADPYTTIFPLEPFEETRGIYYPETAQTHAWISLFLVGDMLGEEGKQFVQWVLEELTAWGKVSYRKEDNSLVPMLTDGTSIEGYVCKQDSVFGPRGSVAKSYFADLAFFWAYALAYRLTGDEFMWQMAGDIGIGNSFGNIGESPKQKPKLKVDTTCSNVYGLLGFLELYKNTNKPEFLWIARRIGDNIIKNQFYKGFFVPSKRHIYTRFDCFEPLGLLHLHTAAKGKTESVPQVWPGIPLFVPRYRHKERGIDRQIIYTLTESSEPPLSLQEAAAIGDIGLVRSLLDKGVGVDSWDDPFLKTALHRATMRGHKDVVELLLAKGADIEAGKFHIGTALHFAVEKGHKEIVELLIDKGADVNANNTRGQTPTDVVGTRNRKEIVELLTKHGATISSIHTAAVVGDLARVRAFLENGIDINVKDNQGNTPLHLAAQGGHREVVEFLLSKDSDVNTRRTGYPAGDTPLHTAVRAGNIDIVELLLRNGADTDVKNESGQTPLDIALSRNRKDIIELLISKGADVSSVHLAAYIGDLAKVKAFIQEGIDINTKVRQRTPLHYAAREGRTEIVELLLENGADVNAGAYLNRTAAEFAMQGNHNEIVELLVSKGADIPPLHLAIYLKDKAKARRLIEASADVNKRTPYGTTPLDRAVSAGLKSIVELLIEKGADVNVQDNWDWTPLHTAVYSSKDIVELKDMVKLLIARGANVNAKDGAGRTPLWYAEREGHTEIVELLHKHMADIGASSEPRHDVAITEVSAISRDSRDYTVPVVINLENQGDCGESFNVKLVDITDSTTIGTKPVYLSPAGVEGMDEVCDMIFPSPADDPGCFAQYVNCGGDVNGDGYNDIIMSAPRWNEEKGRVYLYYGGPNIDANPDKIFEGEHYEERLGEGLSLGDLNNDGYDDVILGAPKYSKFQGRVYVFHGGPDMDTNCDLIFEGEEATRGIFGYKIFVEDMDNDNHNDLLITAPARAPISQTWKGRAYLYYGGDPIDTIFDRVFEGENIDDHFGIDFSIGGDIDGDGYKDILIGALCYPGSDPEQGRAYLYYGNDKANMDTTCDVVFVCPESGQNQFGYVEIFDIDNDGYADVLIGSRIYSGGRGRVYIYWGDDRANMDIIPDKLFTGEEGNPQLSGNTIHHGYFNNDDYPDIAVGIHRWHDFTGRVHVYYGNEKALINESPDKVFTGVPRSRFGVWFGVGDLNNDRYDDIVVGGYMYNKLQGRAWLYYGSPGDSTQLKFNWNTNNVSPGKHTLKVEIPPIPGEKDISNNTMTVTVEVKEPSK